MHGAVERLTSHNSDGISPLHGFSHASPRGVYSRVESDRQLIRSARLRGNLVAGSKVGSWPDPEIARGPVFSAPSGRSRPLSAGTGMGRYLSKLADDHTSV